MTLSKEGLTNRLLGYPEDARLLIINADDFGMCHAVNEAIFRAFSNGVLHSTTLMVPCPWALHAMHFLSAHPEIPFGVHLTAISDWVDYRWGPVVSREKVPSLLDRAGYFHNFEGMPGFLAQVKIHELEMEFRAQIETVLSAGLKPTHLDWHALRIGGRENIFDLMFGLAREYGLGLPCNDHDFLDSYLLTLDGKSARFIQMLRELPEWLSEWTIQPAIRNEELLAIEGEDNRIRQTDFDFLMSQEIKDIVREEGIILLDYRALQEVWKG